MYGHVRTCPYMSIHSRLFFKKCERQTIGAIVAADIRNLAEPRRTQLTNESGARGRSLLVGHGDVTSRRMGPFSGSAPEVRQIWESRGGEICPPRVRQIWDTSGAENGRAPEHEWQSQVGKTRGSAIPAPEVSRRLSEKTISD